MYKIKWNKIKNIYKYCSEKNFKKKEEKVYALKDLTNINLIYPLNYLIICIYNISYFI
jgi:hypothetical protein